MHLHTLVRQVDLDRTPVGYANAARKAVSVQEEPTVDVNNMSATATICTDIVDHQREVILASGVQQDHYMNNPVVLYEHGEGITFDHPLAYAEDMSGDYTVWLNGDFIMEGTSFFERIAQQFPVVYQYFGLIEAGVLRATSIHVQPLPGGKAVYADAEGNKYQVTEKSDMIEWSWCKIGVNPEALKKSLRFGSRLEPAFSESYVRAATLQADLAAGVLRRDSLGNQRLHETVRKSLQAMTRTGASQTLLKGNPDMARKSLTLSTIRALNGSELTDIVENRIEEFDIRTQRQLKSMFKKVQEDHGEEHEDGSDHHHGGAGPEKESDKPAPKPEGGEVQEKNMEEQDVQDHQAPDTEEPTLAGAEEPEAKMMDGMIKAADAGEEAHDGDVAEAVEAVEEAEEAVAEESQAKMDFGGSTPLGSQVLRNLHDAVKYLNDAVEEALMPVEHPDVKGGMADIMGQSRAIQAAVDGLHASAYGDALEAVEENHGNGEEGEEGQEKAVGCQEKAQEINDTAGNDLLSRRVKSFLNRKESQVQNFQVISYSGALRRISENKDIPESARKSLANMARGLKSLQEDAAKFEVAQAAEKSQKKSYSQEEFDSIVAERDSVLAERDSAHAKVETLNSKLDAAVSYLEKITPAS